MASNTSRLILTRSAATPRWFSTATKGERASLVQKLSDLEGTEGEVAALFQKLPGMQGTEGDVIEALDKSVAEGKTLKSSNISSCVNLLPSDEKYKHAEQVSERTEKSTNNMNDADHVLHVIHAMRMDLHAKAEGVAQKQNSTFSHQFVVASAGEVAQEQNSRVCEWMDESKHNLNDADHEVRIDLHAKTEELAQEQNSSVCERTEKNENNLNDADGAKTQLSERIEKCTNNLNNRDREIRFDLRSKTRGFADEIFSRTKSLPAPPESPQTEKWGASLASDLDEIFSNVNGKPNIISRRRRRR